MEGRYSNSSFFDPSVKGIMKAAECGNLRYSNFLFTISTNVVPKNEDEKYELAAWLWNTLDKLFREWRFLNGVVLKPAGTDNRVATMFPADHKIVSVNSMISLEQGEGQRGQMHAHVVMEVAHEYCAQEHGAEGLASDGKRIVGVHANVFRMRDYLNANIKHMGIEEARKPPKIYVHCQLLTTGTDNSNKFLSYAYINKTHAKDNNGGERDLYEDKMKATDDLRRIHDQMADGDAREVEGEVQQDSGGGYSFEIVQSFPLRPKSTYQPPKKKK